MLLNWLTPFDVFNIRYLNFPPQTIIFSKEEENDIQL